MRAVACAIVLLGSALVLSACGGGEFQCDNLYCKPALARAPLPPSLRSFVRKTISSVSPDGGYYELDVYGPGSRSALVKASSGDRVRERPRQAKERFYLVVLHGWFSNCRQCSHPAGREPRYGSIETRVWSTPEGTTDYGIGKSLPVAMSEIHRLAKITFSGD